MQHFQKKKMFFVKYWKSLLVLFVILYLSFASPSTFKDIPTFQHADKVAHFLMFALFTGVLINDFRHDKIVFTSKTEFLILSLAFPLFTGAIIEYLQGSVFQPRSAEWLDFFSDTMGVAIGFLLMSALIHFLKKIKKIIRKDG